MAVYHPVTFRGLDEDATVRAILEGTATETGGRFFAALVENLSIILNTYSSWVTEYIEESRQLRALGLKQADDVTLVIIKLEDLPPSGEDWQI